MSRLVYLRIKYIARINQIYHVILGLPTATGSLVRPGTNVIVQLITIAAAESPAWPMLTLNSGIPLYIFILRTPYIHKKICTFFSSSKIGIEVSL